jgi:hypothetical protein
MGEPPWPDIASCRYIRKLEDVVHTDSNSPSPDAPDSAVQPSCLLLEWMEHDLRTVFPEPFRNNSDLPRIIARSVLSALALLKADFNVIHTGELVCFESIRQTLIL